MGFRTITMSLDASQGVLRNYINWLLEECTDTSAKAKDVIDEQAIDYLTEHLTTPLQVEQHLTLALEEAYAVGVKPITVDLLSETLSRRID